LTVVDPFVIQQAEIGASRLVRRAGFTRQDWDDLRQDLILDYLERLPRFDRTRGDLRGFMFGVVRHRAAQIAAQERRRARRDSSFGAGSGASPCRGEALNYDLRLDVVTAMSRLPERLRTVAELLMERTPGEVALITGKSRSRIYQLIKEIRQSFLDSGVTPEMLREREGVQ
jgi:RNA polymerase sigma-70 factor (ECF subfamily)